jgi:hypothetical protein
MELGQSNGERGVRAFVEDQFATRKIILQLAAFLLLTA